MQREEQPRRLAAIVVADVVGFTRLMEDDQAGTLSRLQVTRSEIVDPTTRSYSGRIVKGTGDGWLAEFASVTDAVRSSLDIQDAMARQGAADPSGPPLAFRIGINIGEVMLEGGDIFGTGVNVAARLEALAEPGGVTISSAVREQLRGVPDLGCDDLGERVVKNVDRPVRCYRVRRMPLNAGSSGGDAAASASVRERAAIAVLPFLNLSPDPNQEYFADGMVDDILTALARFKWLRVIARNSTFAYKGRQIDVRQVAKDLGVRYVLEGSVRKSERRVRITGQLIDAATGAHVWADKFEGALDDIFDLQDHFTESVVGAIEPQIRKAEIERARRKRPENLDAYDLFLRALPHAYAMRPDDNAKALELLEAAIRLDPGHAPLLAFAAWCYEQRLTRRWPSTRPDDGKACLRLARAALAADTDDANAMSLAGFELLMVGRDYEAAFAALRRALSLNPHNAFVLMNLGWAHIFAGNVAQGLTILQRARAMSPSDPTAFYVLTGIAAAELLSGNYEAASKMAADAASQYAAWDATFYVLATAHAHLGRMDEARVDVARLLELAPGASISHYRAMLPISDPARFSVFESGLRAAGLPE